jgi:hypothetical protein
VTIIIFTYFIEGKHLTITNIPVHFMDECHVAKIKGMAEITQVISSICFDKKKK